MGGGTGTGGCQYKTITLDNPWGESEEQVRIWPPCQVEDDSNEEYEAVIVFTKGARGNVWKRTRIGWGALFPSGGFIAWDDKNNEYAWHEVGTVDVPSAVDPGLPKSRPAIIRGESETINYGSPRRQRRRFVDWFTSKSRANEIPDFLRKGT